MKQQKQEGTLLRECKGYIFLKASIRLYIIYVSKIMLKYLSKYILYDVINQNRISLFVPDPIVLEVNPYYQN